MGGPGNIDGVGTEARFLYPTHSAMDAAGNLYVVDVDSHVIRRITPTGVVSTVAGIPGLPGADDGPRRSATFFAPSGIAVDKTGNIYVSDGGNYTVRRISGDIVTTIAGTPGVHGTADGRGPAASFGFCYEVFGCPPPGIAVDSAGNVLYADVANSLIRRITPDGVVTTIAGGMLYGLVDGPAANAQFNWPAGLAVDGNDNIFVADARNSVVRKITPNGIVSTVAGDARAPGYADGDATSARFALPVAVAVDTVGNLYVADKGSQTVRRIGTDGRVTTLAGVAMREGSRDGPGNQATFRGPAGVSVDTNGSVFVSDSISPAIRRIDRNGMVSTFAGLARPSEPIDGTGTQAVFFNPHGIVVAASGDVFVADMDGLSIRRTAPNGTTTTLAGQFPFTGSDDGIGLAARFTGPSAMTGSGNGGDLFVIDVTNCSVRRVTLTGAVTTLAGNVCGYQDGTGRSASFRFPRGITIAADGVLFVADTGNHNIRRIDLDGTVTTLAGSTQGDGGTADGIGTSARFFWPVDLVVDPVSGDLFVVEQFNHSIRRVTRSGVVTTFAGMKGTPGVRDGVGNAARFYQPWGIAADDRGNFYVTDYGAHTIRKITRDATVTTVAGTPFSWGYIGGALPGSLSQPLRIAYKDSTLYVTTAGGVVKIANVP